MAMQVPIPPQQPLQHRLVDHPAGGSSRPRSSSTSAGPGSTGAAHAAVPVNLTQAGGTRGLAPPPPHMNFNSNNHSNSSTRPSSGTTTSTSTSSSSTAPAAAAAATARDHQPPSYAAGMMESKPQPRSPADDLFPPNKVDLDAARYRQSQQQQQQQQQQQSQSRRERPTPPSKDPRDNNRRPSQQSNGRPSSNTMAAGGAVHHGHPPPFSPGGGGGRPVSPDSSLLATPTGLGLGPGIQRMPTPSLASSVLQPLDAKVAEYGALMAEAQAETVRLDEEMRALQEHQREAEQRFLEAKAKHDDYRRQYADVERALRGDLSGVGGSSGALANGAGGRGGQYGSGRDRGGRDGGGGFHDDEDGGDGRVPPVPSMPNLHHYGQGSGSGNLLRGNNPHPGMQSQRTVSYQSDDGEGRPGSKRGRWSKLFGV
ncbi:hypothetical protein M406DRAFT_331930 [Cryphonectria parasitica EP155]|uniref:Uncharacterized protein n=1 Tax=Cryphonectria parasitica (strain ATCC 38755 / EP155) TaxID=660469 RepID=A0A9P4XYU3_CRYP1|nr:uncharacterized protein M406DRAFT_331930 [Cryphonectria parasitica EP155]KAF3763409.1 hypothetical protein M406DRAFT_331930 [Cryphonectria parasitica EP155]